MTILPSTFDNISHFGPIARSTADAVAFMSVAAGPDDEDIQSLPQAFDAAAASRVADLSGRRFAFSPDLGYYAIAPEVAEAVARAVARMRAAGAIVEEVPLGWSRRLNDAWFELWGVFMSAWFGDALPRFRGKMDPAVVALIGRGRQLDATRYKQIEIVRTEMWRDLAALFRDFEALLCPTCAMTAPAATATDDDFGITLADGRYGGMELTCPFNLVPQCPALSLPVGLAADGLPVGLQIIGRRFADEAVLSAAGAIELLVGEGRSGPAGTLRAARESLAPAGGEPPARGRPPSGAAR